MKILVRALLLSSILVACKGKGGDAAGGDTKVASCLSRSMGGCVEYNAANLAMGSAGLASLCTTVDKEAKFTMTACPTEGVLGSCAMNEHKDYFYEGYPIALDRNEAICKERSGTFVRGK